MKLTGGRRRGWGRKSGKDRSKASDVSLKQNSSKIHQPPLRVT